MQKSTRHNRRSSLEIRVIFSESSYEEQNFIAKIVVPGVSKIVYIFGANFVYNFFDQSTDAVNFFQAY